MAEFEHLMGFDEFKQKFVDTYNDAFSDEGFQCLLERFSKIAEQSGEPVIIDPNEVNALWIEYHEFKTLAYEFPGGMEPMPGESPQDFQNRYLKALGAVTEYYTLSNGHILMYWNFEGNEEWSAKK